MVKFALFTFLVIISKGCAETIKRMRIMLAKFYRCLQLRLLWMDHQLGPDVFVKVLLAQGL